MHLEITAGPMLFLEPTFEEVASRKQIPPGGATPPSRYLPHDAIYAATFYLRGNGVRDNQDLYGALFTYNHADWCVRKVLTQAEHYRTAATTPTGAGGWVVPAQGTCTSGFGPRDGAMHNGLDIAASTGTPITGQPASRTTHRKSRPIHRTTPALPNRAPR